LNIEDQVLYSSVQHIGIRSQHYQTANVVLWQVFATALVHC